MSDKRKSIGQELKEASDNLAIHQEQEKNAAYWISVKTQAKELCSQAIEQCRLSAKQHKRRIVFGEIIDENVAISLIEFLTEEEIKCTLHYNDDTPSIHLNDEASYWQVDISW